MMLLFIILVLLTAFANVFTFPLINSHNDGFSNKLVNDSIDALLDYDTVQKDSSIPTVSNQPTDYRPESWPLKLNDQANRLFYFGPKRTVFGMSRAGQGVKGGVLESNRGEGSPGKMCSSDNDCYSARCREDFCLCGKPETLCGENDDCCAKNCDRGACT